MLAEAIAEVGVATKTAIGGNLRDGAIRIVDEQMGGILQAQLQYILIQSDIIATLREHGTHALLRQLEAVHDGLAPEIGIEEEVLV